MIKDFRGTVTGGALVVGPFVAIPHPVAVEVTAACRPDFLCIDAEHGQIGRERLEDLIRASDVHGVPALVRVPGHVPDSIAAALDAGAAGIVVPRVSTADEARAAVAAMRYPPLGQRGVGPGRAAAYGYRIPDYLESANRSLLLAIQVETAAGLANIGEIVAVEGIDVVFIGPGDLSVSIDATGPEGRERLQAAIVTIAAAATSAGRIAGLFRPSPEDIALWRQRGISFFILGSDTMVLGAGMSDSLAAARGQAAG